MKIQKNKISQKFGIPAEEIVFIGDQKTDSVNISVYDSDTSLFTHKSINDFNNFNFENRAGIRWIDVTGLHNTDILKKIGKDLKIHPLILADIANTEHNPKIQFFDDYIFLELKVLSLSEEQNDIVSQQLSLILGKNFIASFREFDTGIFDFFKERIISTGIKSEKYTADYIHYSLIDAVVDKYYEVLETIGEEIETIEDEVIARPKPTQIETIHHLKRKLIFLRKATWPLREIIKKIEITKSIVLNDINDIYIKDLYDHIIQIIDTIETQREIVAEMLDIYLSSVSFKLNEIMKVLTIIATIFIPLTFISSIYGMNFKFMPELDWKLGYPLIMTLMFAAGLAMLYYFKKKKWF